MRRFLLLCFLFTTLCASGGPFVRTYKSVPLAKVLQEIEAHFSLQIIYRPQDIAKAPAVNCSINTADYQTALKKVLGNRFTYTVRNNIVVITVVPPQQQTQTTPPKSSPPQAKSSPSQSAPIQNKPTPKANIDKEADVSHTSNPSRAVSQAENMPKVENSGKNETFSLPPFVPVQPKILSVEPSVSAVRLPKRFAMPKITQRGPTADRSNAHAFLAAFSVGYGSELMTQLDLRYGYYFHPRWGVGGGLDFAFAMKNSDSAWQEEGRIGLPIALNMRYPLARVWGIRAAIGATPSFCVYSGKSGTGISNNEIDVIPFLEIDAMHTVSKYIDLLFGLYTHISAISVSPWSVGVHIGFEVGK